MCTFSTSPNIIMNDTADEPPYEMNGSVTPVSGMTFVTPPTMTNTCRAKTDVRPVARSFENGSRARVAMRKPRLTIRR